MVCLNELMSDIKESQRVRKSSLLSPSEGGRGGKLQGKIIIRPNRPPP